MARSCWSFVASYRGTRFRHYAYDESGRGERAGRRSYGSGKSRDSNSRDAHASNPTKRGAADLVVMRAVASLGQPPGCHLQTAPASAVKVSAREYHPFTAVEGEIR